jgi:hypothetical protein
MQTKRTRSLVVSVLVVFSLAVMLAGCGIKVPDDKQDYVGEWDFGETDSLVISASGQVDSYHIDGNSSSKQSARLKAFEGNNLTLVIGSTIVVSQPPHQEGGKWVMVANGLRMERRDAAAK